MVKDLEKRKNRKDYIIEIARQYKKAKKDIDLYKDGDIAYGKYIKQKALVNNVDKVLTLLSKEARDIIINDFFQDVNKYWWIDVYSKSTYYRHYAKATKDFVYYYQI